MILEILEAQGAERWKLYTLGIIPRERVSVSDMLDFINWIKKQ